MADSKTQRLIDWNIDVLLRLLKQVVARRISRGLGSSQVDLLVETSLVGGNGSVLGEVKEIIALPHFDASVLKNEQNADAVVLDESVKAELREYVSSLASMYRNNPFHNFEASIETCFGRLLFRDTHTNPFLVTCSMLHTLRCRL